MSWGDNRQALFRYLKQLDWQRVFGFCFLLALLCGLYMAAMKLSSLLYDASRLPIEAVAVKGTRQFTSDQQIKLALDEAMQRSFFAVDVDHVQAAVEALPWVYQVSVRREWPTKLKLYLVEQAPIARWNQAAWLNRQGEVFVAPEQEALQTLPQLIGPQDKAQEVLGFYQQVDHLLRENGFRLMELKLTARHAWHVHLDNGIRLALGREDKMARIKRFINVYPEIARQGKRIAAIDLRYDTGLAVNWDETNKRAIN